MSQRSQIEWLKFGRLRNERLFTRTDQCEYYCFHIFCSFLSLRSTPSVVRPLRDNYHFLFPITKADVWNKLEKVWPTRSGLKTPRPRRSDILEESHESIESRHRRSSMPIAAP